MPRPLLLLQVIAARVVEHEPIRVVVQLYERTRRVTLLLTAAARGKHEPRISDCSVQMALFCQLHELWKSPQRSNRPTDGSIGQTNHTVARTAVGGGSGHSWWHFGMTKRRRFRTFACRRIDRRGSVGCCFAESGLYGATAV